jgi:hypothetical protein
MLGTVEKPVEDHVKETSVLDVLTATPLSMRHFVRVRLAS